MGYDERVIPQKTVHEWEKPWTEADWKSHESALVKLDAEYIEIVRPAKERKMNPFDLYQIRHDGLNKDLEFITSKSMDGFTNYYINKWKLDKLQIWRERNMTPNQRVELKSRIIKLFSGVSKLHFNNV